MWSMGGGRFGGWVTTKRHGRLTVFRHWQDWALVASHKGWIITNSTTGERSA
jgi:hypothetical protein